MADKYDGHQSVINISTVSGTNADLELATTASGISGATVTISGVPSTQLRDNSYHCVAYTESSTDMLELYESADRLRNGEKVDVADWDLTLAVDSVDAGGDTITIANHGMVDEDGPVNFTTTGSLPGGLSAGVDYFLTSASGSTFRVSLTPGGSVVPISSAGSGDHTLSRPMGVMVDLTADGILDQLSRDKRPEQLLSGDVSDTDTIFEN